MLTESYTEEWRHWHDARVDGLNAPYGWLSLISQDWLEDNVPQRIDGIPGTWLLRGRSKLSSGSTGRSRLHR